MSYVVVLVERESLSGQRNVRTFGPYESHAEAHRARSRVHMEEIYGKGAGHDRDRAYISEMEDAR